MPLQPSDLFALKRFHDNLKFSPGQPRNKDGEFAQVGSGSSGVGDAGSLGKPISQWQGNGGLYGLHKETHIYGETLSINGVPKKAESLAVSFNGEQIGQVRNYAGYKDTKVAGRRYVTSRKQVVDWTMTINEGHHAVKWHPNDPNIKKGSHTEMGLHSKQGAIDLLQRYHKVKP